MATDIKLKDFILYNCTSIKKELKKKGLIILNVIDNVTGHMASESIISS
jgi:hypothetical protein